VESVGLFSKHLPFSSSNNAITYFRHALALDERRVKFIPSFHGGFSEPDKADDRVHKVHKADYKVQKDENRLNNLDATRTDVKEVFFAGAHCGTLPAFQPTADMLLTDVLSDVGGGSVSNGERHSLARIPLRWMIKECFDVKTGIIFDAHMLKHQVGLVLYPGTTHEAQPPYPPPDDLTESDDGFSLRRMLTSPFSWIKSKFSQTSPPESVSDRKKPAYKDGFFFKGGFQEELNDALSPIYDELDKHWYWKAMEWFPCELPPSPEPFVSMTSLKGLLGRNASSWITQTTPGATGTCMSPHFLVYPRCR
jgi:hypothetical protein